MKSPDDKTALDEALHRAIWLLQCADDDDIPALLGDGVLDDFLQAIAKPKVAGEGTPYEYLLTNRHRLQLLALLRLAITQNYSIRTKVGSVDAFVSPTELQWYPEGVMFVQGMEPFAGLIGLYEGGRIKFAISARAASPGDSLGKDDFLFVDPEEAQRRSTQPAVPSTANELDDVVTTLVRMLEERVASESAYQDYFTAHPWVFGAEYKQIDSHRALDDSQIPDFTAVRVHDSARDIIEIKSPTMPIFQQSNDLRAEFHASWDQAERYLDFARRESDYLRRQKGLFFDNPYCYLIAGHNLTREQIGVIRLKERLNPAIKFRTYDDVCAMAKGTVTFLRQLRERTAGQVHAGADGAAPNA